MIDAPTLMPFEVVPRIRGDNPHLLVAVVELRISSPVWLVEMNWEQPHGKRVELVYFERHNDHLVVRPRTIPEQRRMAGVLPPVVFEFATVKLVPGELVKLTFYCEPLTPPFLGLMRCKDA